MSCTMGEPVGLTATKASNWRLEWEASRLPHFT